jgi:hypothetical protein
VAEKKGLHGELREVAWCWFGHRTARRGRSLIALRHGGGPLLAETFVCRSSTNGPNQVRSKPTRIRGRYRRCVSPRCEIVSLRG